MFQGTSGVITFYEMYRIHKRSNGKFTMSIVLLGTLLAGENQQYFLMLSAQREQISDNVAYNEQVDSWWKLLQPAFLSSGHGGCRGPSRKCMVLDYSIHSVVNFAR